MDGLGVQVKDAVSIDKVECNQRGQPDLDHCSPHVPTYANVQHTYLHKREHFLKRIYRTK